MVVDKEKIYPLLIQNSQEVLGIRWVTEKITQKIIEQKELWEIHPQTYKEVQVYPIVSICNVKKKMGWYLADIDNQASAETISQIKNNELKTLEKLPLHDMLNIASHEVRGTNEKDSLDLHSHYNILFELVALISERKKTMPEGSYTTHLFRSGADKIRKKLGEESIEVILAKDKAHIVEESADLLYHLLVFLNYEDIDLQHVMQILVNRHMLQAGHTKNKV